MAWLEIHQNLTRHPKTRRLAIILGMERPHVVGHLIALWGWALEYAEEGDLSKFHPFEIADAGDWPTSDAERFIAALVEAKWIDKDLAGGLTIHDWEQYSGKYAKEKKQARERVKKHREKEKALGRTTPSVGSGDPEPKSDAISKRKSNGDVTLCNALPTNQPNQPTLPLLGKDAETECNALHTHSANDVEEVEDLPSCALWKLLWKQTFGTYVTIPQADVEPLQRLFQDRGRDACQKAFKAFFQTQELKSKTTTTFLNSAEIQRRCFGDKPLQNRQIEESEQARNIQHARQILKDPPVLGWDKDNWDYYARWALFLDRKSVV